MRQRPDPFELLQRLASIAHGRGADALVFERRLAREQGWSLRRARAVTVEYHCFLALLAINQQPLCPSEAVDAAWHLHLTDSRDYTAMCDDVFGRYLHHDPSAGGAAELARHRAMYCQTLLAYRRAFRRAPPPDVWPGVDVRFGPRRAWHASIGGGFSLSRWIKGRGGMVVALALATGAALAVSGMLQSLQAVSSLPFLAAYVAGIFAIALLAMGTAGRAEGSATSATPLGPYEVAYLSGGNEIVAATAVVALLDRGLVALEPRLSNAPVPTEPRLLRAVDVALPQALPCIERQVCARVVADGLSFDAVKQALAPAVLDIEQRLQRQGMLVDEMAMPAARLHLALGSAVLLVLAALRCTQALVHTGAPVGLLLLVMVLNMWQVGLLCRRQSLTERARQAFAQALQAYRAATGACQADAAVPPRRLPPETLAMGFALTGLAAVAGHQAMVDLELLLGSDLAARLRTALSAFNPAAEGASGSGGGGGGDSGGAGEGGGDGGGGGCGGCGGG